MFASRISVTEYMVANGLVPLHGPNEKTLVVDEGSVLATAQRRLQDINSTSARQLSVVKPGDGSNLHPIRDGRLSGFHCLVFPRTPLGLMPAGKAFSNWGVLGGLLYVAASTLMG